MEKHLRVQMYLCRIFPICLPAADVKLLVKHLEASLLSHPIPFIHCCMMKSAGNPESVLKMELTKFERTNPFRLSLRLPPPDKPSGLYDKSFASVKWLDPYHRFR